MRQRDQILLDALDHHSCAEPHKDGLRRFQLLSLGLWLPLLGV